MTLESRTRRLLVPLRRRVSSAARLVPALRPTFSVLVDLADCRPRALDRTLHSVRAQPERRLEILVPPGLPDDLESVARRHGQGDWRVRRKTSPAGDLVLTLIAGDELTDGALHRLAEGLTESHDDAVVGQVADTERVPPAGDVSLQDRPELLRATEPGRALLTRDLWEASPPDAGAGERYVAALLAASRITVLEDTILRSTHADPEPFGAMDNPLPELDAWLDSERHALSLVTDGPLRVARLVAVLSRDAGRFLDATERMDAQWPAFRDLIRDMVESLVHDGDRGLLPVPVETRVKAWLAAQDRRAALEAFVAARRLEPDQFPTKVDRGRVYALLPGHPDRDDGSEESAAVPLWCLEVTADETPLVASLRGLRWAGDLVELDLFAFPRGVSLAAAPRTEVALLAPGGGRVPLPVAPRKDPAATRFGGSRFHDYDLGAARVTLDPAAARLPTGRHVLEVTVRYRGVCRSAVLEHWDPAGSVVAFRGGTVGDRRVDVTLAPGAPVGFEIAGATETPGGRAGPRAGGEDVLLDAVRLDGEAVRLRGSVATPRERLTVVLAGPRVELTAVAPVDADGTFEVRVPLRADEWGLGERPAPSGRYRIRVAGTDLPDVGLAVDLAAGLPLTFAGSTHRVQLRHTPRDGRPELVLGPPLGDDELGAYRQARLQQWYVDERHRIDERLVYLQAYTGESATDSPLAIYHELRRRRPDLRPVWGVADHSAWLPEGARSVLWRSRDWYATIASAGYVVTNIELEPWFRSRPGQRVLQTFHGHPSKSMGIGLWRSKGFTESRIEQQLDRTSRLWDLLLTPAPEMDRHYREQYRYDGPILAAGYPRDDVLVGPRAQELRDRSRARLGAAEGQTVVLYAPTWRDDLATNHRRARMGDHFDVRAAAAALGPGYTLLVRGHRFHARGSSDRLGRSSVVVDVTDHPEVNDLVLAADAAVLDYSSLRFDAALTGMPMVFLVPDLDSYAGGTRGFLYDFRETAPGPLVSSTDEVVAALRDLPGLRTRYATAYQRFNRTYNYLQDGHAAERAVEAFFS